MIYLQQYLVLKRNQKIGEIPRQLKKSPLLPISQNENKDIEILGIITDEVNCT